MLTHTATRKVNGDELVAIAKNVIGPWKAGKFMPLTMRSHSLNTHAFSKLWNRTTVVDLRAGDIKAINTLTRSWLNADLLEKPEELALWRNTYQGGLNLYNIALRAKAYFINTFLETSCKPGFQHSLFHETFYNQEVRNEECGQTRLTIPPYFTGDFFPTIRRMKAAHLCATLQD